MIKTPRLARISLLISLVFLFIQSGAGASKSSLKKYRSPDSTLVVNVLTVTQDDNGDTESKVEFRTAKGKLIGGKSFMSKDHAHGLGVVKAVWTIDSKFFVFSTIASGGNMPGDFPTFYFNRKESKLHLLNTILRAKVTNPEFDIEFPDGIEIMLERPAPDGKKIIAETRTVHLSALRN
ncbi:MAG TPA: hypothetical protein VL633_07450 [Bacteroidota bacterium]|jgi:hypothetical protein|nr:hypothetical protein [Bacteroidota bacterium]